MGRFLDKGFLVTNLSVLAIIGPDRHEIKTPASVAAP
jgi:hypothetical protein